MPPWQRLTTTKTGKGNPDLGSEEINSRMSAGLSSIRSLKLNWMNWQGAPEEEGMVQSGDSLDMAWKTEPL